MPFLWGLRQVTGLVVWAEARFGAEASALWLLLWVEGLLANITVATDWYLQKIADSPALPAAPHFLNTLF